MSGRSAIAGDVEAALNYLVATDGSVVYRASDGAEGQNRSEGAIDRQNVPVADGRAAEGEFTLDGSGFAFCPHETAVTDFHDAAQITDIYEPELAALVSGLTGARRAVPFDHTLRTDSDHIRQQRQVRDHVELVHNDYTERSARRRVRDLMPPEEAEEMLSGRFAIVNVWRSIGGPAETTPLAMCDARTIAETDLIPVERHAKDRIGEMQQASFNPAHRWVYFPRMERGEVLVFKTYDSVADGRARLSLHSAFANPMAPADAPPRQSMETRLFVMF